MGAESFAALARRRGLRLAYGFGSRAKELRTFLDGQGPLDASSESDVDVGVLADHRLTLDEKVTLASAVEDSLGVPRVDIVDLWDAPVFLALDVVTGELLFAADLDFEAEYQLHIIAQAGDLAPFERERRSLLQTEGTTAKKVAS